MLRIVGRLAVYALCAMFCAGAAIAVLLAWPQPLFAHEVHHGRLSLHSDRPFQVETGRAVLADVQRRLAAAPPAIADPHSRYRVFVVDAEWRGRLTFLNNYGAGGVNYYPLAENVFLRRADMERGLLLRSDGHPVPEPRSLAYFAAHEIAHSLIGKRIGAISNWRLPIWIREGLADYVGFAGEVDIDELIARLRAGDTDLDPAESGLYARYRLLVAYFLEREHWSVDELLASGMTQADAEQRLLAHAKKLKKKPDREIRLVNGSAR